MANSEYNLTVVDGTALTISLSGPVGPAGAGGGSSTISTSTPTTFTGYIYGNGTTIAGATVATSENTANTLVKRDANGSAVFSGVGIYDVDGVTISYIGVVDHTYTFGPNIELNPFDRTLMFLGSVFGATPNYYTFPDASGIVPVYTGAAAVGKVLTSSGTNGAATWQTPASGSGSVTSVSVTTANGVSGSVATSTTTPAITLSLGAITPTSVNGNTISVGTGTLTLSSYTLTVAGTASVSGTNTGDQTNITGNAATVTTNANLTGHVTSTGNAAVLGSFTIAQLNTAVSDADVAKVDAQTHTGAHVFSSTTRPTSSGSGTPDATSLMKRDDEDTRMALNYLRGLYLWSNKYTDYTAANVGTGGSATNNDVLELTTGATTSSVGFLRSNTFLIRIWHISLGAAGRGVVNWSLRTIYNLRIVPSDITGADTVARFLLGQVYNNTTAQDLTSADRGIGFKIIAGLVYVQVANATILTTTSTATTISSLREYDFTLDSDGAGNWVAYINGSNVASGTGAPTGNSTATNNALCMSLTNGTTAANRQIYVVKQSTLQIP